MSQYLFLERIKVQNANAVSSFTWGFPSITHFLGFTHNLNRKLQKNNDFKKIGLNGCVVIAHQQNVLTYKDSYLNRFTQVKSSHYLGLTFDEGRLRDPAINEEAKMNMTVSLLIPVEGYLGGNHEQFLDFVRNSCFLQRLAGGTVLDIKNSELIDLSEETNLRPLRNKLLPGFVLQDRSNYLEKHFLNLQKDNPDAVLLDAWFDFIALKQTARPNCELIDKYFEKKSIDSEQMFELNKIWIEHKSIPYNKNELPEKIEEYFKEQKDKLDTALFNQWKEYTSPDKKTAANWEYEKKPEKGFLIPIMTGYKAISEIFPAGEIDGARDIETDLCFVEAVHSVGEWQSVHRLKSAEQWEKSIWNYTYEEDWYLCKQNTELKTEKDETSDDVYN